MPKLTWIGKEAVVNHHRQVPYRLLQCDSELSAGTLNGNLLVEGDNLEALKALLPYYARRVKLVYIDPPYNTGNEGWVYSDAVSSPQVLNWLHKAVGGVGEDLSRNEKWLCMMYPRLRLLHEMLCDEGSLWMSLDDNEIHHARAVLDEIFGPDNFVATVIWQKIFSPKSSGRHLSADHDFILVYAKNAANWQRNLLPRTDLQDSRYKNPDDDPRGVWASSDLSARNYYSLGTYPVTCPSGRVIPGPPKGRYWTVSKKTFEQLDEEKRIWWGKNGDNMPRLKRFLTEVQEGVVPRTIWLHGEVGNTQEAKKEVVHILPDAVDVFPTPKPTRLIRRILQIATKPGDIVLDSFAGSGTTGHAVLQLNHEDSGDRRFILVEMESPIARVITAERIRRVVAGYSWTDTGGNTHQEPGLGGGFRYCSLGHPLFLSDGSINPQVTWGDLARHVWFTETYTPWSPPGALSSEQPQSWLGTCGNVSYYLYFNGIGGNVFGRDQLAELPAPEGLRIVYADVTGVSPTEMGERGVAFKQIPYDVKVE